ncbi:MAG TPA: FAD/NAD(P)-binding protein [Phototrophicaceae bacterium]|nr:FAD/NAD(P)-binding protein [Phototrophicaceae bacterium]
MKTIVIIGGGFSGMMTAAHLLRNTTSPTNPLQGRLQVIIVEPRHQPGAGVAYSTTHLEHRLNVDVRNMSAFPDHPDHFYHWLMEQTALEQISSERMPGGQTQTPTITPENYVPRAWYRDYLQNTFQNILDTINTEDNGVGVRFEHVQDCVVAVYVEVDYAAVTLASGITLCADAVVLASGNLPPRSPAIADRSFYQNSSRYIENGWANDTNTLTTLNPDDSVLLIGTGLTTVDHLLTLRAQGHRGKIFTMSRHGLLPLSHLRQPTDAFEFTLDELPAEPRLLLRYIRDAAETVLNAGGDWHSIINGLRPLVNALWQRATETQRCQFLRHLLPYWTIYRHRIPADVANQIETLQTSGQLTVVAGWLRAFEEHTEGVEVSIQQRGTGETCRLNVQQVINCTGPSQDYRTVPHPLIRQLLTSGLCRPGSLNLGLDTDPHGALIDKYGQVSDRLFTLGPSRKGHLLESTAVPELREQAFALAHHLLKLTDDKVALSHYSR